MCVRVDEQCVAVRGERHVRALVATDLLRVEMSDSTVVSNTAFPVRWRHTSEVRRVVSASISLFSVPLSFLRAYCVAIWTSSSASAYSTNTLCSSCSSAISASSGVDMHGWSEGPSSSHGGGRGRGASGVRHIPSQSSVSSRSASVLKSTAFSFRSSTALSAASHFLGTWERGDAGGQKWE